MTFREVVGALDANGEWGAKRPSMRGYAYKRTRASAEETVEAGGTDLVVVAPDGGEQVFAINGRVAVPEREIPLDAVHFEAYVFADDWNLAARTELEKGREGGGM